MEANESKPDSLTEQIERAREDARHKREQAGLPPLSPDNVELPRRKGKKPGGKRTKRHGQFMAPDQPSVPDR